MAAASVQRGITLARFEELASGWVKFISKNPGGANPFHCPCYITLMQEAGPESVAYALYWIQRGKGGYWTNFLKVKSRSDAVQVGGNTVDETHLNWVRWSEGKGM